MCLLLLCHDFLPVSLGSHGHPTPFSTCFLNAAAKGCALAYVPGLEKNSDLGMNRLQTGQDLAGTVAGAVVDANQFNFQGDCQHTSDYLLERGLLVVDGHG